MIPVLHRAQNFDHNEIKPQWGVELDLRPDANGDIMLAHDPDGVVNAERLGCWLNEDLNKNGKRPIYCMNIKSDGILNNLRKILTDYDILLRSMIFDMSFAQLKYNLQYTNLPYAVRVSDEEEPAREAADAKYVWLDRWDWLNFMGYRSQLHAYREWQIYAVSPELHDKKCPVVRREKYWNILLQNKVAGICTDCPNELEEFIKNANA